MKELALNIFGEGEDLLWWQMGSRAVLAFFLTLALIRISGRRSFSMRSPFDNTVTILLGAVLSRGIVGASPMAGTMAAAFCLVLLHRICAWLCIYSPAVNRIFKGSTIVLYENGEIRRRNLYKSLVSEAELRAEVRTDAQVSTLENVDRIMLEGNGRLSIIKKE